MVLLFDCLGAYYELRVAETLPFLLVIFSIGFFGRLIGLYQQHRGLRRSLDLLDKQFVALLLRLFNDGGQFFSSRYWLHR
jgi:hypothetical protein